MVHPEWLNQNEHRAYPFREDAVLVDASGTIAVPNNLVLDLVVTVEALSDFELYMSSLTKAGSFYSFVFADTDGVTVATVSVDSANHYYGQAHALTGSGEYVSCRGRLALGRLESIDMPDGIYLFTEAVLEACTVRPDLRAVRSLRAVDAFGESEALYGDIRLVEGRNIRLTTLQDQNAIQIDAITDESYAETCECETDDEGGTITSVNGISVRNLQLVAGAGVSITAQGDTLKIASPGVQPCCGCTELGAVTAELDRLREDSRKLATYAETVERTLESIKTRLYARSGV